MKFQLNLEWLSDRITPSVTDLPSPPPQTTTSQLADPNFFSNVQSGTTDSLTYLITQYEQWYTIRFSGDNPEFGSGVEGLLAKYNSLVSQVEQHDTGLSCYNLLYTEARQAYLEFVTANPNAAVPANLIVNVNSAAYDLYTYNFERNQLSGEAISILNFLGACRNGGLLTLQQNVALTAAEQVVPQPIYYPIQLLNSVQNLDGTFTAPGWPVLPPLGPPV